MRQLFNKRIALIVLSIAAIFFVAPHNAYAFDWFDISIGVLNKIILSPLEILVLPLAAGIMALSGLIMDAAIQFGLHTAYIFSLSPAINLGWVIVRDIANLFFIFILIFISIGTIVQGTRFGTMSLLKNVIIAALLINFSLFFTKAAIDVSNVFGNWLYGGVQKTLIANSKNPNSPTGLSGLLAQRLGILGFWTAVPNADGASVADRILNDPSKSMIGIFLRLAIVLITTYIFLYCAILFIARSITLLFLLVFSPIAFMSMALPQLKKYSSQWKDEMWKAGLFPLMFLLMLYISLQFINSLGAINFSALQDKSIKLFGMDISVSQYFQYFIIIFLLQATLKVAKEHSGSVGDALGGVAKNLGQLAIGATTGGAAFAGRKFIGAYASKLSEKGGVNDLAAGSKTFRYVPKFASQLAGKAALGTLRGTAKSSFDLRGLTPLKDLAKNAGVDIGKAGGKDGYKGAVKELEKNEAAYAKEFGDSPEGIARRMAYAESTKSNLLNTFMVSKKGTMKAGEKVESEAMSASTKGRTEKARKDAQKVQNQIVQENIGAESLHNAVKSAVNPGDEKEIDRVLRAEQERIKTMSERSRAKKDKPEDERKNQLAYNRYDVGQLRKTLDEKGVLSAEDWAKIDKLNSEFEQAQKEMTSKEIEELEKATADIKTMEESNEAYMKEVSEVIKQTGLRSKKIAADNLAEYIKDKRIGKPAVKGQKSKDGAPAVEAQEATGLRKKLEEAKKKVTEAQKEQSAILGREKGGGGDGGGKKEGGGDEGKKKDE